MIAYEPKHRQVMRQRLRSLLGRWLAKDKADEARLLAQALGVELVWKRFELNLPKVKKEKKT